MDTSTLLQITSIIGVISMGAAFRYTVLQLSKANGTRPLIEAILLVCIFGFPWAIMVSYIAFLETDALPDGGVRLFVSLYGRILPTLISVILIYMGYRLRHEEEGDKQLDG